MEWDGHFCWYVIRASGIVAFVLLALATGLGLAVTSRLASGILNRRWVFEVHKAAALLALAFVGLHLGVLIPEPWTDFEFLDLLLPGASAYRPLPVAMGVLAMYGAVLAASSFYIKRLLGHRTWRALHFATFGTFVLALLHGVYAGTDSGEQWMKSVYLVSGLLIFFLTVLRILAVPLPGRAARGTRGRLSAAPRP